MNLEEKIMANLKNAMKEKNTIALDALRAVKSQLILLKTSGSSLEVSEEQEISLLQRLIKQRNESAEMFNSSGRTELAETELAQAEVIKAFLPKQMTREEIEVEIKNIISELNITNPKEFGKVIAYASKKFAGKADGKTISEITKDMFS